MFKHKTETHYASSSLSTLAWKRYRRNKLGIVALFWIAISVIISIAGYLITPDATPFANNQNLELETKNPGFSVKILKIKTNQSKESVGIFRKLISGKPNTYNEIPIFSYQIKDSLLEIEKFTGNNPNAGEIIFLPLAKICLALKNGNYHYENTQVKYLDLDANEQSIEIRALQNQVKDKIEDRTFHLGTDRFGRDMLSQLIIGSRVSLSVGLIAVLISLLIGITLGLISGYFGGKVDQLTMWFINVVWSIPTLLLVIAITMALGRGFWQVFIAVGLTMWVEVARVVRGQVMSIRNKEFVEACVALGYSNFRILFRHILPNVLSPLIVISAANFASAILIEAGLSFLGIGVQPPIPSWGTMIKEHYGYIILDKAYLAMLPGIAIMMMVLAFMLVGNALRDALDVKMVKD